MFYFGQWVPEPALERRNPSMVMQCAGDCGEPVLPDQPGLLVPDMTKFADNGWREQEEVTSFGAGEGARQGRFTGGHTVTMKPWHLRCWLETVLRLEVDTGALASMLIVR